MNNETPKGSDRQVVRALHCPKCNKPNILRQINSDGSYQEVSKETMIVRGKKRFIDICQKCLRSYLRQDQAAGFEAIKEAIETPKDKLELA